VRDAGVGGAERLVVGLAGAWPDRRESAWLRNWRPAGVLLFRHNVTGPAQLRALCARLRELLPPGGEIVADHEGGPVSVLELAAGRPPAPATLGAVDDPVLTRAVHAETARRARALGVDRLLAPCADVLTTRGNPVIGARSFGTEVERVVRHVAAAVGGLREGGVSACVKHWPGHGGTWTDSHEGPVTPGPAAGGRPFAAALAAGADAIMIGHLPRGGARRSQRPATLDPAAVAAARTETAEIAPAVGLWSDDVTMGAVAVALAADGVLPLSDASNGDRGPSAAQRFGLVDPARLPPAWFAALAAAGCDRWLVRGIPWGAFPLDDAAPIDDEVAPGTEWIGRRPFAKAEPSPVSELQEVADADAYADARRRAVPDGWSFTNRTRLLWLDATRGDRWGASGIEATLRGGFTAVRRAALDETLAPGGEFPQNVVVTSHRPLAAALRERLATVRWPERGSLLLLGHPALGDDLAPAPAGCGPPDGWRRLQLGDVTARDLAPALR
jgi:hypothetical protein